MRMSHQKSAPQLFFFGALFFILFIVLRIVTWLMLRTLTSTVSSIPHVLSFSIVENTGVAFGIQIAPWATFAFSFLFTLACIAALYFVVLRRNRGASWALLFMSTGAASNFVDRLHYGSVIDYLLYPSLGANNIADYFITIGVSILVIYLLIHNHHARSSEHGVDHASERRTD